MQNASFFIAQFAKRASIYEDSSKEKRAEKISALFVVPLMPPSLKRRGSKPWRAGEDSNLRSSDSESEILSS